MLSRSSRIADMPRWSVPVLKQFTIRAFPNCAAARLPPGLDGGLEALMPPRFLIEIY